jgi:hypothetical protein
MPKGKPPERPRSLPVEGGWPPLPGAPGPPRWTGGGIMPADPIWDGVTNDALDPVAGVARPFCCCNTAKNFLLLQSMAEHKGHHAWRKTQTSRQNERQRCERKGCLKVVKRSMSCALLR